jgi:hypothetical protein
VSEVVADVVERALQRTPANRFASARDMAAAIHETGELPATADDVTDFLDTFAADALAKQRRTVARALAKAAGRPTATQLPRIADPETGGQPDFDDLFGVSSPAGLPPVADADGSAAGSDGPDTQEEAFSEEDVSTEERILPDDELATVQLDLNALPPSAAGLGELLRANPKEPKPDSKPGVVLKPKGDRLEHAEHEGADGRDEIDVPEPDGSLAGSMDDLDELEAERLAEDAAVEARRAAAEDAPPEPAGSLAGSMDALEAIEAERVREDEEAERAQSIPPAPREPSSEPMGALTGVEAARVAAGEDDVVEPDADQDGEAAPPVSDPPLASDSPPGMPAAVDVPPARTPAALDDRPDRDEPPVHSRRPDEVRSKARRAVFVAIPLLLGGAMAVVAWPYLSPEPSGGGAGEAVTAVETTSSVEHTSSAAPATSTETSESGRGGAAPADAGADAAQEEDGLDAGPSAPAKRWKPRPPVDIYEGSPSAPGYSPGGI